ncbi:MAG: ABC transporter permease [Verrucomicrobiae bacterium]|nr:ABC transporter permease [Verrucomicrobiae bacterium]
MNLPKAFQIRFRALFRKRQLDAEMDEEMRAHIELRTQANIEAGMNPEEARFAALRQFGRAELFKEECRDQCGMPWLETLLQDIHYGARQLRKNPSFTAVAVLTLALGIGATTAIFSIVHAVLLQPLPFHDPTQLVRIWEANPEKGNERALVSAADFNDWRVRSHTFDELALFNAFTDPTVLGIADASVQAKQAVVTPNLFALLGVQPALGRPFGVVSDRRGPLDGTEIILSHGFWQRAFGGDTEAVGQTIRIEGVTGSTVVGVMPPGYSFPDNTDFWTSMDAVQAGTARRDMRVYGAIGRLSQNVSLAEARSDLQSIAQSLEGEYPASNAGWTTAVLPLHESVVGSYQLGLMTLFAAVSFVMLVGCANVSNLLLARGIGRRGELAIRAALGASRAKLVRLLLAETAVLATAGAAAGVLLARWVLPGLIQLAGDNVPRLADARVSSTTLAFSVVVGFLSAIGTGLIPALRHSRTDFQRDLTADGGRSTKVDTDIRLQRLIVAGELAVCLVLLVGAMLFAQTFVRLRTVDLGFNPEQVISVDARIPIYRTLAPNRWQLLASDTEQALERVRSLPGVLAAAAASDPPLAGNLMTTEITLAGDSGTRQALYHRVSPEYFRTLGMTLVQGRDFTREDMSDLARLPAPRAAVPRQGAVIVNETTARTFWPSGNAIGQFLSTSFDARPVSRRQIVGIVRDARSESIRGGPPVEVYVPYLEDPSFAMTLLVRTTLPTDRAVPLIRRELRIVSADLSTANVRMLNDMVGDSMRSSRFSAFVISVFAVAALLLSALGVFGVCAFGVASRVQEIGIRMALGAAAPDIVGMFLRQSVGPIVVGVIIGTAGAIALGRLVDSLLFGVASTDAASYATAASMLVGVALAASYLPVRRVLRADPARALRG